MRNTLIILFLALSVASYSQAGWVISKMEQKKLENGLEVVMLYDTTQKNVFLTLYSSYRPVTGKYNSGVDKVFAYLTGGRILLDSVFARTLISNPEGLDSALRFVRNIVYNQVFDGEQVSRAITMLRQNDETLWQRVPRFIYYPRDYALGKKVSEYIKPEDVMNFRYRFDLHKTTLILAGNLPDSTLNIVRRIFSAVKIQTHEFSPLKKREKSPHGLYFVNIADSSARVGVVKGFDLSWPIDIVKYRTLEALLRSIYPESRYTLHFSSLGSYFGIFIETDDLHNDLKQLLNRMKDPLAGVSASQIEAVGAGMAAWLDSTVASPTGFEDMIYFILRSGEKPAYLTYLREKFLTLDYTSLKDLLPKDLDKKITPVVIGNELLIGCDILKLSANYDISFTDAKLYRYKLMKKGFNAWTVIDRYVSFVSPHSPVKNLTYQFDAVFFVDSSFMHLKGFVWKKAPDFYRYQTFVITSTDTLLHQLLIFDGNKWVDSTVLGSSEPDSITMRLNMQKTYILGEKYYKQLGYEAEIICDPDLLASNIYKIQVHTGDLYFEELYDMGSQTKLQTVIRGERCWYQSFYYFDYRRLQDGRIDFKIPYVVVEQTPYYTLTQSILAVSFRPISKRIFRKDYYFWPGKQPKKGFLSYISRGFDKIKKLCIF